MYNCTNRVYHSFCWKTKIDFLDEHRVSPSNNRNDLGISIPGHCAVSPRRGAHCDHYGATRRLQTARASVIVYKREVRVCRPSINYDRRVRLSAEVLRHNSTYLPCTYVFVEPYRLRSTGEGVRLLDE